MKRMVILAAWVVAASVILSCAPAGAQERDNRYFLHNYHDERAGINDTYLDFTDPENIQNTPVKTSAKIGSGQANATRFKAPHAASSGKNMLNFELDPSYAAFLDLYVESFGAGGTVVHALIEVDGAYDGAYEGRIEFAPQTVTASSGVQELKFSQTGASGLGDLVGGQFRLFLWTEGGQGEVFAVVGEGGNRSFVDMPYLEVLDRSPSGQNDPDVFFWVMALGAGMAIIIAVILFETVSRKESGPKRGGPGKGRGRRGAGRER